MPAVASFVLRSSRPRGNGVLSLLLIISYASSSAHNVLFSFIELWKISINGQKCCKLFLLLYFPISALSCHHTNSLQDILRTFLVQPTSTATVPIPQFVRRPHQEMGMSNISLWDEHWIRPYLGGDPIEDRQSWNQQQINRNKMTGVNDDDTTTFSESFSVHVALT